MADTTSAAARARKQIEFYFSDSNLPRDKYLLNLTAQNSDGFVPLEELAKFKRVQQMGLDNEALAAALGESDALVVSDDGKNVRRAQPLPAKLDIDERSIYAKGFVRDGEVTTIESITELFAEHGKVLSVRLRRTPQTHLFKGSAFVEFATVDEAKAIIAKEIRAAPELEPLAMEMKLDYLTRARAKKIERRNASKAAAAPPTEEAIAAEVAAEIAAFDVIPGCVVHVTELASEGISREDMLPIFRAYGDVQRVDFSRGQTEGYIRFAAPVAAAAVADLSTDDTKRTLADKVFAVAVVDGEAETKYWHGVVEARVRGRISRMGAKGIQHAAPKRKAEDDAAAGDDGAAPAKKQKTLDGEAAATAEAPAASE
ncbi:sjogren syndrome antigen B [Thecamonas trahens ATCC 50062]|uniref:Sjogren syndrome antigen B n=1 Tax=Thecamonas trahens ATCC 50062 TaxID=461836 RepID=A0A0L0DLK2_THETB|nr:sjogren syndrome antigen B [Thecamonas trahens ATCC 50062]KNC53125.1 sjogren syndrome antigen B [Thecamonas trahens ATCC 50062]|eukprot:XP_013754792.1 sjogren syndrome antigen B [Thecamonas trahens ATCC 50062]